MPGGRPKGSGTKYEAKYCELIVEYFERLAAAETRELAPLTIGDIHNDPDMDEEDSPF